MTSDMKPVAWRCKSKVDGWIIHQDEGAAKALGSMMGWRVYPLYTADQIAALQAEVERLREALGPFAEASDTAAKIADIHGENEFVLCFGPVPVGVIPLEAFIAARAALKGGSDAK